MKTSLAQQENCCSPETNWVMILTCYDKEASMEFGYSWCIMSPHKLKIIREGICERLEMDEDVDGFLMEEDEMISPVFDGYDVNDPINDMIYDNKKSAYRSTIIVPRTTTRGSGQNGSREFSSMESVFTPECYREVELTDEEYISIVSVFGQSYGPFTLEDVYEAM